MKLVESSQFKKLALTKKPRTAVKFASEGDPVIVSDSRTFRFVFSDSGVDRDGDRLNAQGWEIDDYNKNSIVLFSHDSTLPIGRASNIQIEGTKLSGDITFADTELANTIYELVAGGFLKAVSVGFMPLEYEFSKDKDRQGGIDYNRQRLLEVSVVAIPANPRALIEARFAGIEVAPLTKWMAERVTDKTIPASEQAVFKDLLNTMNESDPSSGGMAVPACDRDRDEECAMDDPDECEVHRQIDDEDNEDKTLMAMTQAMKAARAELKRLNQIVARLQKDADDDQAEHHDDEDGDNDESKSVHLKMAAAHVKAANLMHKAAHAHHLKAIACYGKCDMGDDDMEDKDEEAPAGDDEVEDKKFDQIMARARAAHR